MNWNELVSRMKNAWVCLSSIYLALAWIFIDYLEILYIGGFCTSYKLLYYILVVLHVNSGNDLCHDDSTINIVPCIIIIIIIIIT